MNLVCPVCGSEYLGWVTRCSSCGVALVPPAEAPNPLDLPEEDQVVYEMGAWPLDQQAEAAAALAESGIPHAFDGSDLVVHVDHEEAVDAMLDAIEAEAGPFDVQPVSDDAGELAYTLDGWSDDHRDELAARLEAGGVPYQLEEGALVVAAVDEAAVDFLVAEVRGEEPTVRTLPSGEVVDDDQPRRDDGQARASETGASEAGASETGASETGAGETGASGTDDGDGGDDDDDGELVSELFDVGARLERRPDDRDALVDFAALNARIDPERPPFGIDELAWERVVAWADDLADALTGEGGSEPEHEGEEGLGAVALAARRLRLGLRPFV